MALHRFDEEELSRAYDAVNAAIKKRHADWCFRVRPKDYHRAALIEDLPRRERAAALLVWAEEINREQR